MHEDQFYFSSLRFMFMLLGHKCTFSLKFTKLYETTLPVNSRPMSDEQISALTAVSVNKFSKFLHLQHTHVSNSMCSSVIGLICRQFRYIEHLGSSMLLHEKVIQTN